MNSTYKSGLSAGKNNFVDELLQPLRQRQQEIVGNSRYELIAFFWEIGKQIDEYSRQGSQIPALALIQDELTAKFGGLFKEVQLPIMWRFAQMVSEPAIMSKMASYFDWNHIACFAKLQNEEELFHFIDRSFRDSLSAGQLEKEIDLFHRDGNASDQSSGLATYTVDQKKLSGLLPEPTTALTNKVPKDSLYTGSLAPAFAELFESNPEFDHLVAREEISSLSYAIRRLIQKFRSSHSTRINGRLNLIFLELGRIISDKIAGNKNRAGGGMTLDQISALLRENYDSPVFSERSIAGMILFHEKSNDRNKAARIAHLVDWEDLLALLQLHDSEDMLIYARLLAQKKLTVSDHIPDSVLEDERRLLLQTTPVNKQPEVSVQKTRNSEVRITETFVALDRDILNDGFVMDIFGNPYFVSLMREAWKQG